MREIKFRAWIVTDHREDDKPIWEMIDGDSLAFEEYAPLCDLLKDKDGQAHYMQYTGLKDKNGKEIYEDDIVKCHDHPTGVSDTTGKVYWKDGKWRVSWSMVDLGDYGTAWTEVIGNIYENPELLTTQQG